MTDPIYLDYNATTPLLPEVVEAMLPYLREHFGNPSSGHVYGKRARDAVERAREQVASLLRCWPEEIYFTSGGTEANNLAIRGVARAAEETGHIVTSAIEHPATEAPCALLEEEGWRVSRLKVDASGCVDLAHAYDTIDEETALVTVMHANNVVGTIEPIHDLGEMVHDRGGLLHLDASQSLGKIGFGVEDIGVDLMTLAGHKLYAPKGVGALFVREGTPIEPLLVGAGHEDGLRPGTENVASLVGLGVACELAEKRLLEGHQVLRKRRDELWEQLRAGVPGIAVNGDLENCLPNTLNVRFPGVTGPELLEAAPGVAASTGSACHEGELSASPVLLAMGIPAEEALGAVRLSVGVPTTRAEIEKAATELVAAWKKFQ